MLFESADPHATVLPRCIAVLSMAAAGDMHCGSTTAVLGVICCGDVFPGAASFCKPSSEPPNPESDSLKNSNWTFSADLVAGDVCGRVGGVGDLCPTLLSAYRCIVSSTVSDHSGRQSDSIMSLSMLSGRLAVCACRISLHILSPSADFADQ